MYATGALDPNWWKYQALNHRWYRDDDAYADYREPPSMNGLEYLCVHFDGARGYSLVSCPWVDGQVSFTPSDDPFEVTFFGSATFDLKDSGGTVKYRVTKLVCDTDTLTFTMLKLSNEEEISVAMGIAPEGFTTDLFATLLPNLDLTTRPEVTAPPMPSMVMGTISPVSNPQPLSQWNCPCGTANTGKFCTACGHKRE